LNKLSRIDTNLARITPIAILREFSTNRTNVILNKSKVQNEKFKITIKNLRFLSCCFEVYKYFRKPLSDEEKKVRRMRTREEEERKWRRWSLVLIALFAGEIILHGLTARGGLWRSTENIFLVIATVVCAIIVVDGLIFLYIHGYTPLTLWRKPPK